MAMSTDITANFLGNSYTQAMLYIGWLHANYNNRKLAINTIIKV